VKWKPLLWFVKGTKLRTPDYVEDLINSQSQDKTVDRWAQSQVEATYVIDKLTVEGNTILDPMMGPEATTGIATIDLKRRFVGIEID
jgi:DNA modification methylase